MIADKAYLEKNKFRLWQNSYLKKDKDFSGLVLYQSLEGKFVNGWRFTNGEVTHTVTNLNFENGPEMKLKSGYYSCTTQDIFGWYQECTDYYTVGESGSYYSEPTYSHTTCGDPYLVYEGSYQECTWVVDSGTSTSGGYLPGSNLNDTLKKLFYKGTTNLDPDGIDYLNMAFDKMEMDCMFNSITNYLQDKSLTLGSISINTNQFLPARYNGIGDLTFVGNSAITSPNLSHEWFHIGQKKMFNTNLTDGYAEFENWLFADIRETIRVKGNFDSSYHNYACYKYNFDVYKVEYQNWLKRITNNGTTFPTSMDTMGFYKFGPIFAKEVRTEYSFLNFSNNNTYLPRTMIYLFENCK